MFKPRLRIPRRPGAARLSAAGPRPSPSPSPFVVPARRQQPQQQQRSLHASPARRLHSVAPLTDDKRFEANGVPGLLSIEGFDFAYTTYQAWVLSKLNEMVTGTQFEDKTALETLVQTSREPHLAATFNYASMAHNNHFFFNGVSKTGGEDRSERVSDDLLNHIERSFGSFETLRREFIMTADAMFGPGFVWLVQQLDAPGPVARPFRILTTYQAGTPYSTAHWRSQSVDMNNHGGAGGSGAAIREYFDKQNVGNRRDPLHGSPGAPGLNSMLNRVPPGGTNVIPVLCVNTWEHVWMWDYGVEGKANFVSNWWNIIDWGRVQELSRIDTTNHMSANPSIGAAPAVGRLPGAAAGPAGGTPGAPQ